MKYLLTRDHMGLEISKRYSSYSFHGRQPNFNVAHHGGMQGIIFLVSRPRLKKMLHFEILTWE